mgnify:CR=1 FL=1
MRAKMRSLIFLILVISVLLTGCGLSDGLFGSRLVSYDQMEYTRPNMVLFSTVLDKSCTAALEETDIRKLEDAIWAFYDVYDGFYTNLNLAFICYASQQKTAWQHNASWLIIDKSFL